MKTDGKILKSSTIYLRDNDGEAVGIFAINYDITMMVSMENALRAFTSPRETSTPGQTPIARNVTDLLDELIEQSMRLVGKPVALMTKGDKVKAIRFLNDSGAFLITKSGQKACTYFGISKYTLYSDIDTPQDQVEIAPMCKQCPQALQIIKARLSQKIAADGVYYSREALMRLLAYSVLGFVKMSSVVPCSRTRPSRMTMTRSLIWRMTLRSCDMNR